MFNSDIWAIERAPDGKPWVTDIREYIEHQTYPEHERKMIRRQSGGWQCNSLCVGAISINYDGILLLCVKEEKAEKIREDAHNEVCGPHMNGRILAKRS